MAFNFLTGMDEPAPVASGDKFNPANLDQNALLQQLVPAKGPSNEDQVTAGFGAHGTLGHILGALGDAFLVQGGAKPAYSDRIHKARIADALSGFQTDPDAAIERVGQVDPALAIDLSKNNEVAQYKKALTEATQQRAQETITKAVNTQAFSLLGAINPKHPETYDPIRKQFYAYYAAKGMTPPVELPEQYDPEALSYIMRNGLTPEQQVTTDYKNTRIGQIDRGLDISQQRADDTASNNAANVGLRGAGLAETIRNHGVTEGQRDQSMKDRRANIVSTIEDRRSRIKDRTQKMQPKPADIDYLKSNPDQRAQFDAHFGAGTSARILGK